MHLIKRLFLTCVIASAISVLFILLGPSEGLEALGGVLVAYFALLFHIPAGLAIAVQAYRIKRFDAPMAGILVYFLVIYGIGIYYWAVTTGADDDIQDLVDEREDPAGFRLRALGEQLYIDQMRRLPVSPDKVNHMRVLIQEVKDVNAYERAHKPALWYAAALGELSLIDPLIERGAALDDNPGFTVTPLYEAVRQGHAEAVRRLAEAGANPDAVDHRDVTALAVAADNGDLSMVNTLLAAGANVNVGNQEGTALTVALRTLNIDIAKRLLEAGAEITNVIGMHPVDWAYRQESNELLELLASKPTIFDTAIGSQDPPLFERLRKCKPNDFEELLNLGASPNVANQRGELLVLYVLVYDVPRCEVINDARPDIVSLLIDHGLDLAATDHGGSPLVLAALNYKRVESARRLVAAGAPIDGVHGIKTFPILAAANGANDLIDIAIARGMDSNQQSKGMNASTPLHEAADGGHLETIKHLLANGAVLPDASTRLSNLYRAAGRHPDVLDVLLEHHLAGDRTREEDRAIRRGVLGSKNEASVARLDELGIR